MKNLKRVKFHQTTAKTRDVKTLETIILSLETMQQSIIELLTRFSESWGWKTLNYDIKCPKNYLKNANRRYAQSRESLLVYFYKRPTFTGIKD